MSAKKRITINHFFMLLLLFAEKAEKMGQSMTKVPYKETFWKGTMRTRPREYSCHKKRFIISNRDIWVWLSTFWFFQAMVPSTSRPVLIISSSRSWQRSMRTSLERSVELQRSVRSLIFIIFQLLGCLIDRVLCVQLWQGRWQGDEIIVKVLQVRDWTTRKSRDFNEEHPKLR